MIFRTCASLLPLLAVIIISCNKDVPEPDFKDESGKSLVENITLQVADFKNDLGKTVVECIPPQNPYNDNSGQEEGFKWAKDNMEGCNGSEMFKEGCKEYRRLFDEYHSCLTDGRESR